MAGVRAFVARGFHDDAAGVASAAGDAVEGGFQRGRAVMGARVHAEADIDGKRQPGLQDRRAAFGSAAHERQAVDMAH